MDELRAQFGFEDLNDEWCDNLFKDDFCSYTWPESWTFQESAIGLEEPFENFLSILNKKQEKIWDSLVLSDVTRLQCITNIVLESCIKSQASPLTGLICSACYLKLSAVKGASARNVFHDMIFGKVMEILKTQEDPELFSGLIAVYNSLTELLKSDFNVTDRSYWLLVKSSLSSINLNCTNTKANNHSFDDMLSSVLIKPPWFKIFIKQAFPYISAGNSYLAKRCSQVICKFVENHLDDQSIVLHHLNFVKHLCGSISNRTETRKQVEVHILEMIRVLPQEGFLQLLDWITSEFSLSDKVVHRLFGVELCFQLSFHGIDKKPDDHNIVSMLYATIIKHICDKAPTVRAKSAMVISDLLKSNEKHILAYFAPYFDYSNPENILKFLELLSCDSTSSARKATCQLWLMILLKYGLNNSWLKVLYHLCLDTSVSVKKQALIGICQLLTEYNMNPKIQRLWLETILQRTTDNENSVKDFCGIQLQNLLENLSESQSSWEIIQLIAHPKSIDLQTLFDNGIRSLLNYRISNKSKSFIMEKLAETENTQTALFIISKLTDQFKDVGPEKLLQIFDSCLTDRSDENYQTMCIILSCIRKKKKLGDIDTLVDKINSELQKFCHPYLLIKDMIITISNLLHRSSKENLMILCEQSIAKIGNVLQNVCLSKNDSAVISSKKICCYLFTLGELSSHFTKEIDNNTVLCLKELIINNDLNEFSVSVRAHAVLTFGKICLVHEDIAKDSVLLLCNVLEDDQNIEIRNNIMIVLGDLIVRYPTIIADYLFCVTDRLKDTSVIVKRQAIIVITKLLQEDYIKWRSGTVMKFITNLVDDNAEIRQLCELCLTNILLIRYPETFTEFFVEVIFFLHGLLNFLTVPDPNLLQFSLPGIENESKRRKILMAMLQNFNDQQKLGVTSRICKEVLSLFISDDDKPIDAKLVPLLQDSLWILSCDSLKLSSLKSKSCHDFDDDDSKVGMIAAQTKVISAIVIRNFVENCTPIIMQLNHKLKKTKSPLQLDFNRFIVYYMKDFKDEIEVLSGGDTQFIAEVQFDIEEFEKHNNKQPEVLSKQKSVFGSVITPGFLKTFKTPQSGIALSLSLSKGPSGLFQSPFFTAPTPHTVSKSVAYSKQYKPNNVAQNQLRKNLLANFACTSSKPAPQVRIESSDISSSITVENEKQNVESEDFDISEDHENMPIKIINSPVQVHSKDRVLPVTVIGVKEENVCHSSNKDRVKQKKNLFNPEMCPSIQDASINVRRSSRLSMDNSLEKSRHDVLLTKKAGKDFIKVLNKEKVRRVLIDPEDPQMHTKEKLGGSLETNSKPLLLGQFIKKRLQNQRRKRAECETSGTHFIGSNKSDRNKDSEIGTELCPIAKLISTANKDQTTTVTEIAIPSDPNFIELKETNIIGNELVRNTSKALDIIRDKLEPSNETAEVFDKEKLSYSADIQCSNKSNEKMISSPVNEMMQQFEPFSDQEENAPTNQTVVIKSEDITETENRSCCVSDITLSKTFNNKLSSQVVDNSAGDSVKNVTNSTEKSKEVAEEEKPDHNPEVQCVVDSKESKSKKRSARINRIMQQFKPQKDSAVENTKETGDKRPMALKDNNVESDHVEYPKKCTEIKEEELGYNSEAYCIVDSKELIDKKSARINKILQQFKPLKDSVANIKRTRNNIPMVAEEDDNIETEHVEYSKKLTEVADEPVYSSGAQCVVVSKDSSSTRSVSINEMIQLKPLKDSGVSNINESGNNKPVLSEEDNNVDSEQAHCSKKDSEVVDMKETGNIVPMVTEEDNHLDTEHVEYSKKHTEVTKEPSFNSDAQCVVDSNASSNKRRSARINKIIQQMKPLNLKASADAVVKQCETKVAMKDKVLIIKSCKPLDQQNKSAQVNEIMQKSIPYEDIRSGPTQAPAIPKAQHNHLEYTNSAVPPSSQDLPQLRVNLKENVPLDNDHHDNLKFQKPKTTATLTSNKRINKILKQLMPITTGPIQGKFIENPDNILLANQVLRKRKNPNSSGHHILQEDDLVPKPKRRSYSNIINSRDSKTSADCEKTRRLSKRLEQRHDNVSQPNKSSDKDNFVLLTPAVEVKMRRSSERLMNRQNISFNANDPNIISSTPFVFGKHVKSSRMVSSTPFVSKEPDTCTEKLNCDLSPIRLHENEND